MPELTDKAHTAAKARQSGHARARADESDDYDPSTKSRTKPLTKTPVATSKRPPTSAPKPRGKQRAAAKQDYDEEDMDEDGDEEGRNAEHDDGSEGEEEMDEEEEEEEEVEQVERKPVKQAKGPKVKDNDYLKGIFAAMAASEAKKAQAKKRPKKPVINKIDEIFDQGMARLDAALEVKDGYTARKAAIRAKIKDCRKQVTDSRDGCGAMAQVMKEHQDANETLIKDLNGIITDRQASVRAIDTASTLSQRRSAAIQDKIAAIKLEVAVMVDDAAAHNQVYHLLTITV